MIFARRLNCLGEKLLNAGENTPELSRCIYLKIQA
jgi:hypothetical protein